MNVSSFYRPRRQVVAVPVGSGGATGPLRCLQSGLSAIASVSSFFKSDSDVVDCGKYLPNETQRMEQMYSFF